jgi:mono/diheme cytochrome c family protein
MKRILVRAGIALGAVTIIAVAGGGSAVNLRWKRTFESEYPALHASSDPSVIERGKYLAYGPAHCAYCHTPETDHAALDAGQQVPLRGGMQFDLPFGKVYSRNLTPDPETGIGSRTDGELARILRHGVRADGRAAIPFMEFHDMSDEDLVAVISFLRSQPAVKNEVPDHAFNFMGKGIMAFLIEPVGPAKAPPAKSPAVAPTVERGEYLANNIAACVSCHTNRSMKDGSYIGPQFAGGQVQMLSSDPNTVLVTPNLTPDPKTGHITNWTEDEFVARFRQGVKIKGSHMPWGAFARMHEDDVRALYRYLRNLQPVENNVGPMVQPKKK